MEQKTLVLLDDLQKELAGALNSLGGKPSGGLYDHYEVYMSGYVNRAAEGFVFLRKAGRIASCKLLVRPGIEAAIRLLAIRKSPELLYRIAFSEHESDAVWFRAVSENSAQTFDETQFQKQWDDFRKKYVAEFPQYVPVDKGISLVSLAEKAGIGAYYDSHYRTYCKYAHGALRAVGGALDEVTDSEDNRTLGWCVFVALEGLPRLDADCPNLDSLRKRLTTLDSQE
jgi:hypothetical protein